MSACISEAHAQTAPPSRETKETNAEEMFQRAMKLYAEKNLAEACPAFAESYRLDPSGGTLQNLAICYEEQGKTATAYARFQELRAFSLSADSPRPDRVKLADDHIKSLVPKLTHVRVSGPGAVNNLLVKVDDVSYERPAWSGGILVDPGKHAVSVSAPGKKAVNLAPVLADTTGGDINVPVPVLPEEQGPVPRTSGEPTHPYRTAGITVGAVGLAAVATGAVFGVLTFTTSANAHKKCGGPASQDVDGNGNCYTPSKTLDDANREKDQARQFGTVSTVLLPVGLLAAGVGTYLYLHKGAAEPGKAGVSARLVPASSGVLLLGEF